MTIWDKIYKNYLKTGEEYATLRKELVPQFVEFMAANEFKDKQAFDVGCGNGKYLVYLKSLNFEVRGIDSSETAVEMARKALGDELSVSHADMYEYEYPESEYGLVISIAAIHHGLKAQVARAIKGIYKSLMPGGRCFVTLPDNEGSSHWVSMSEHEEIEPGTRVPLSGPEKGLPHSSYAREEIEAMFADFSHLELKLLEDRGRWIITGEK